MIIVICLVVTWCVCGFGWLSYAGVDEDHLQNETSMNTILKWEKEIAKTFKKDNVLNKRLLYFLILHGTSSIFDDSNFIPELFNIRECLNQNLCPITVVNDHFFHLPTHDINCI